MQIPQIEPFQFIRSTAFSERVQLANKINEIIDGINSIGEIPDLESQVTELTAKVSELEKSIGNTDTSLSELETQLNALVSEVNTTIKQSISALESEVDGIDTRLTTAEGTISEHGTEINGLVRDVDGIDTRLTTAEDKISEHGTEIDGLLKEVIDTVVMTSSPHGTVQVQINHEDGSNDISAPIDLGLVEQGGITLQSGTTDRSFKLIVTLTDGTSWQTNDFVIPEGGGTEVSVTNISIAQGTGADKIQVKIGLSDGSTISSNDWTVVTPSEFSALGTRVTTAEGNITKNTGDITQNTEDISGLGTRMTTAEGNITKNIGDITQNTEDISGLETRMTTAEGKITKNTGDISNLDSRVQTLEDSPGFTLQPATATTLGGVKIGANVKVQADGTISVDLSPYALKTEIPDVSDFVTAEDVAADYQPKGNYLTAVPIGGTAIGGVKNGGNVTIEADGTMNFVGGDGWEELNLSSLPTDFAENDIVFGYTGIQPNVKASSWTSTPSITDYTQVEAYRPFMFMLTNSKQFTRTTIAEFYNTSSIPAISSLSLYYVNTPSVWNEGGSSTDGLFQFAINAFNGSGSSAVYAPTIHKDNITQFVHKMWRLKSE